MNGVGTAQASFPRQATRMENIMSTGPTNLSVIGSGLSAKNCLSGSRANSHLAPHATISKASSSLASSTYQAHGYLPHFGSAGKAHTSSLYQGQGNQLPPLRARVNLPSSSSYDDRQSAFAPSGYHTYVNPNSYNVSNHYHTPINFGIDGTEEIPASKTAVDSKANQHTHPALNYKGVTTADYETKRDDPDNGWHRGTVDDFFRELAETESKNMSTHQRVNTQSAAYSSRENK
ncbi:hypothetical protein MMC28_005294 [Mycoblastus sanguinarius]|nr:hypothetical protein [Mycoblastus sanguinarius]